MAAVSYAAIDKLTASNYATWREDVRVVLLERNLWDCVMAAPTELVESPEKEGTSRKDGDSRAVARVSVRRAQAYSILYLNVSSEFRPLLAGVEDPHEAWNILENYFRPNSRASVVELTNEFFECKIKPGESMGLYGARLRTIIQQLDDAGRPISDWLKPFQLIRDLPEDYKGIVQIIYRFDDSNFKFDTVLNELLSEEARLKLFKCSVNNLSNLNDEIALSNQSDNVKVKNLSSNNIKEKEKVNSKETKNLKGFKCFKCGRMGHFARNCRKGRKRLSDKQSYVAEVNFSTNANNTAWLFDTAASSHFCSNRDLFSDFQEVTGIEMKSAVDGAVCNVLGKGTVVLNFKRKGQNLKIPLTDVLFSPKLRHNLMAGHRFESKGATFVGKNGKIDVYNKNGEKVLSAKRQNGLYYVFPEYHVKNEKSKVEGNQTFSENQLELWHRRFAHINKDYILNSVGKVRGLPPLKNVDVNCEPCKIGKAKRVSFRPIGKIRSVRPLELLHLDVAGPLPVKTRRGNRYFLTIVDDFSRKVCVYLLEEKSQVFKCFVRFQKRAERFTGNKVLNIRTDNGAEFCLNEFQEYLDREGIKAERTNTYSPEQNGLSERFNLTALNAIRTMLNESGLPENFWGEALLSFVYVWNRVVHKSFERTPFELYGGKVPSVRHLRIFGSTVFVGVPKQKRTKLDMRAEKGILVGYALQTKGYRVYISERDKVVETINVKIEENFESRAVQNIVPLNNFDESESENSNEPEVEQDVELIKSPEISPKVVFDSTVPTEIVWFRKAVPRLDGSRTDIYYSIFGTKMRLRSRNDAESYCNANGIPYDPDLFDFSTKNSHTGIIKQKIENCSLLA